MRARMGNHDGGVDEDERVCDDDKRRALNLATTQVLATFLSTRKVIDAFQPETMGRAVVKPVNVSEMGTERAFAREAA